ncbi:hypothetical protein GOP47_0022269 [Adiantum capillus-veneris]|uniref:Uncharacterized protein n=1 Tax=Adiantum capillus-veneris TaxID=13818 RepID=A0A9D4U9F1_ADICA|nr:hypothetical protein GOP47_0022269 [Adiantum capillus-veneris]
MQLFGEPPRAIHLSSYAFEHSRRGAATLLHTNSQLVLYIYIYIFIEPLKNPPLVLLHTRALFLLKPLVSMSSSSAIHIKLEQRQGRASTIDNFSMWYSLA